MKNTIKKCASMLMLILLVAGMAVAAAPALAESANVEPAPKPTSVKLSDSKTLRLAKGSELTLTPTLSPANAATTFTWKSSKKKVATVSNGVVKGKKVGTTTITVTTRNKKKAKVKVKVYDPYKPTSVRLEQSGTQTLLVMNQLQLNAVMSPDTARSTLKWKSSKKRVAIVNSNGVVSAVAPGKTTITVTTRNKKKAKIKIRVIDDGSQPITTRPDYNLPYVVYACKNSHTIAIIARDDSGAWTRVIRTFPTGIGRNPRNTDTGVFFIKKKERWHKWGSGYSPYANKLSVGLYLHGPIYKSKNHNTIRPSYYNCIGKNCSSGCLRTVCGCAAWVYYNCPVGTQVIVAENSRFSAPRPTKIGKKAKRDPTDPGSNPEILITGFSVEPGALTLDQGASQGIAPVNISPAKASTTGFVYATSNGSVAAVSEGGVVTGVGPGSAVIYVTANDDYRFTAAIPVTVNGGASAAKLAEMQAVEIPDEVAVEEEVIHAGEEIFGTEETDAGEIAAEEVPDNSADDAADIGAEDADGIASEQESSVPGEETDAFTMEAEEVPEELDEVALIEE